MALVFWTDQQVLNQLDSGASWSSLTITYAFASSSSQTVTYSGEGAGFSALNATQQSRAELALRLWDDLIVNDMARVGAGPYYTSTDIEFGNSTTGVGYAHAYFPTFGSVWFNSSFTSGDDSLTAPTIGQHGFASFIHEIGHALGLDHMGDYNGSGDWTPSSYQDSTVYSVMSYFGPSWGSGIWNGEGLVAWADWVGADGVLYSPQTPMLNDIMAIQSIYGVETTTRAGDTVYGFNCTITDSSQAVFNFAVNLNPVLAIFDSAGIDTLDLSGFATSSVINLAPGSFSCANAMTYNIAIAHSCFIENAVGGSGDDVITGNIASNVLMGGYGNDIINGGEGADDLNGQAGNDVIDGGGGTDIARFAAAWSNITFTYNETNARFTFMDGAFGGVDAVVNVETFLDAGGVQRSADQLVAPLTIETAGSVDLIRSASNRYFLSDGAGQICIREPVGVVGPGTYENWSVVQAERSGAGGYIALWKSTSGAFATWTLDATGLWISSTTVSDAWTVELVFSADLDGDSFIGLAERTVETSGLVDLLSSRSSYVILDGDRRTNITSSGSLINSTTYSNWEAIHAEADGAGGYDLLWKSKSGTYAIWRVDGSGAWRASQLVSDVRDVEVKFAVDLSGDGYIGHLLTTIESAGTVSLQASGNSRYFLNTGSQNISVISGGAFIGSQTYSGWSAVQAESDGQSGYNLLWRSSLSGYALWHLDSNGAWNRSTAVAELRAIETLFSADLDGDALIGYQRQTLETAGVVDLVASASNRYELVVGGNTLSVSSSGQPIGTSTYPGWAAIQAEANSAGGFDLLWRSTQGNYALWMLDSSGSWQRSANVVDVRDVETRFAADINNDGHVGHFDTAVESNGSVTLKIASQVGYFLDNGATRVSVVSGGAAVGPTTYPGWTIVQGEADGGEGYRVLWRSQSNGYAIWDLDGNGVWRGSHGVKDVRDIEAQFAADVNGDGTVGHVVRLIEAAGRVDLLSRTDNRYILQDGATQVEITSAGATVGPTTYSGWTIIQAEGDATRGYDLLWRSAAGQYATWHVNSDGAWQSSQTVRDPTGFETALSADLNGDGTVGLSSAAVAVYLDFSHEERAMTLVGGMSGDRVIGGLNGDMVVGGAGNDTLTGGAGNDTFVFTPGAGADVVTDFVAGGAEDRLDLRALTGTLDPAQALTAASQLGADVVIDLGSGNCITLLNVQIGDLRSTDFIF